MLGAPTAAADRGAKSLASCTTFEQVDKSEDTVQLTIANTCTVPIDCAVSWRVVCAPDSKKRRATHLGAAKLTIASGTSASTDASAATCGDDAWTLDRIQWSCRPNKE